VKVGAVDGGDLGVALAGVAGCVDADWGHNHTHWDLGGGNQDLQSLHWETLVFVHSLGPLRLQDHQTQFHSQ
jgi:hypothetical protein